MTKPCAYGQCEYACPPGERWCEARPGAHPDFWEREVPTGEHPADWRGTWEPWAIAVIGAGAFVCATAAFIGWRMT